MKWRKLFGWKWFLPLVTMLIVLTAIVLPERLSALGDRKLFGAAHVEPFDSTLGVAAPTMPLAQRVNSIAALNYGEETDTYSRMQDRFSDEELEQMGQLCETAVDQLVNSGVLVLPYGVSLGTMECYDCSMSLVWDRATAGEASFLQMNYYDEKSACGLSLAIDVESGMAVQFAVFYPGLEAEFAGTDGARLVDTLCLFADLFGGELADIKYGPNDAYVTVRTGDGDFYFHAGQKYDVFTIEPSPSTVPEPYMDITINGGESMGAASVEIYDAP